MPRFCARSLSRGLRYVLSRMRRDTRGVAAVEFAFIAPVFFLFVFGMIETGVMFMANSQLQKATDDAARMVRTGQAQAATMTQNDFRNYICARISPLMACNSDLQVDMRAYSAFGGAAYGSPMKNGNLDPGLNSYQTGNAGDVVLLRVFYQWHMLTPLIAPLMKNVANGNHLMAATAAFQNEPYK